jgi:hypothetical protein
MRALSALPWTRGLDEGSCRLNAWYAAALDEASDTFEEEEPRLLEGTRWLQQDCSSEHTAGAVAGCRENTAQNNDLPWRRHWTAA